ncbi:hypothetical protein HDU98_010406 [Podochytrium sp. JEL0797]|nr:hypothetical protein HDU98_010406 [Podochytrium sp. JEL0797]
MLGSRKRRRLKDVRRLQANHQPNAIIMTKFFEVAWPFAYKAAGEDDPVKPSLDAMRRIAAGLQSGIEVKRRSLRGLGLRNFVPP